MAAADKPKDLSGKERHGVRAAANKPKVPAAADKAAANPVANIPWDEGPRDGSSATVVFPVMDRLPQRSSLPTIVIAPCGGRPRSGCPGNGRPCVLCGACVPSPQWTSQGAPVPTHAAPRCLRPRPSGPVLASPLRLQPPTHLRSRVPASPCSCPHVLVSSFLCCPYALTCLSAPTSQTDCTPVAEPAQRQRLGVFAPTSLRLRLRARAYAHKGRNATTESRRSHGAGTFSERGRVRREGGHQELGKSFKSCWVYFGATNAVHILLVVLRSLVLQKRTFWTLICHTIACTIDTIDCIIACTIALFSLFLLFSCFLS